MRTCPHAPSGATKRPTTKMSRLPTVLMSYVRPSRSILAAWGRFFGLFRVGRMKPAAAPVKPGIAKYITPEHPFPYPPAAVGTSFARLLQKCLSLLLMTHLPSLRCISFLSALSVRPTALGRIPSRPLYFNRHFLNSFPYLYSTPPGGQLVRRS